MNLAYGFTINEMLFVRFSGYVNILLKNPLFSSKTKLFENSSLGLPFVDKNAVFKLLDETLFMSSSDIN
ncbi:hypothetical protein [Cysteiniphilum sp. QT6929]|uniref:hypothetical protein n=1 Tax=Cysteiniphilum sp. QT6929 TaxID=2975055 RepID=UPI0024B35931|nr:hypothetical protein [Cysteiniphilum sp. QT6929]WHN66621.1 hypothetical protein NYP54_05200 [Cysteiniphilum sp. QT6929]